MFHVSVSQSSNSQFVAFAVVFLALMLSCRGQHPVIGPSEPVVALVGEDVTLPCCLNPAVNAFEMTLEWARPDLNPRFVFVWRDGVELKSKKNLLYEGRTSLFTDELKNGNISMILSKLRLSDEGEYKCFVPDYGESKVQLVVGAVSSPAVDVTKNSSTAVLQCESKGWYPEPEVFWLDGEGNLLSAGPTETVRGPDDLYTVSRRLTVEKSHNFTCRVQQKNIKQTRETHFYVPGHFFVVSSSSNQRVVIGSVISCAALMVFLAAVFVWWKRKQRKSKNKLTSPEDGDEQIEKRKTITSKNENTEIQIKVEEEEEESVPLMAAREEKNNEDNRGEQIKSQPEHKDAETQQDQLRTIPEPVTCNQDMDVTGGQKTMTSMNNEEETLSPTQETQRRQNQDNLSGRQVKTDRDKDGGGRRIKPVKEASGPPVILVHTDQEVQKEEETQQEQLMEERQEEKEQERAEKRGSELKQRQQENKRERKKREAERQKMENKKRRELELEKRRAGVKDETEVEPQQRDGDKTQEESKTEHEDDEGNDQEGNQREFMRTTERTAENQEEEIEHQLEQTGRDVREMKPPSVSEEVTERPNLKKENKKENGNQLKSSGDQHLLGGKTEESEAEHEDKKGNDQEGNQSDFTRTEEMKTDQQEQMNGNVKETEKRRDGRGEHGQQLPSVSEEVTERPNLKIHQEPAERKNKEVQAEEQQEETKEQPERSTKVVHVEFKERRSDEGDDDDEETQKMSKETKKQEELQAAKEEIREQPLYKYFKSDTERGVESEEGQMEGVMEFNRRPETEKTQRKIRRRIKPCERIEPLHVDQKQSARRKRHQEEEEEVHTQRKIKKNLEELSDLQMEAKKTYYTEQQVIHEPQRWDLNSQPLCQEDQQEEGMEVQEDQQEEAMQH